MRACLLVLLCVSLQVLAVTGAMQASRFSSVIARASSSSNKAGFEEALEQLKPIGGVLTRLPTLPTSLAMTGVQSFLSTASVMVPIGES